MVNDEAQVSPQRKAKTVAEKRLPKGTSDIQALTATDIAELTRSTSWRSSTTPSSRTPRT